MLISVLFLGASATVLWKEYKKAGYLNEHMDNALCVYRNNQVLG